MDDGAALRIGDRWLVVTTDSHVVHPIFFPGGDIGRLAVAGTVNDLAMMGATELLGLTCARRSWRKGSRAPTSSGSRRRWRAACREAGAADRDRRHEGDGPRRARRHRDQHHRRRRSTDAVIVRDAGLRPGDR